MLTRGVCRATPAFRATGSADVTTARAIRPLPPSFSLREHEHDVAGSDALAAVHGLLRGEGERLRSRIPDLGLDRIGHRMPFATPPAIARRGLTS